MAAFAVYRMRRGEPATEAERGVFSEALVMAQTVTTIDPLSHPDQADTAAPADGGPAVAEADPPAPGKTV